MSRTVSTPTIAARGGIVGRPRINPPPDAAKQIEQLAADGYLVIGIAHKLGVSVKTLREWLNEDPGLKAALDAGRAKEEHKLVSIMVRIAETQETKDPHAAVKAASYLLDKRHGYEKAGSGTGGESRVQITLQLPAAMTVEQYRNEKEPIEHDRNSSRSDHADSVPGARLPDSGRV